VQRKCQYRWPADRREITELRKGRQIDQPGQPFFVVSGGLASRRVQPYDGRVRSAVLLFITACRVNFDDVGRSVDAPSMFVDAPSVSTYEQAVLADHPVAYWRLDDTGSIAHDELGMHDGNFSSGVTTGVAGALVGDPDRATAFDGIVGEATTITGISFPNHSPFTLEVWVNETSNGTYWHFLTCEPRLGGAPQDGYALFQGGNGVQLERVAKVGVSDASMPILITENEWTHVVGVYAGDTIAVYIDGVQQYIAAAASVAEDFTAPIMLGANSDGGFFMGVLDEAAIYASALSPQQIATHYAIARGN